MTEEVSPLENHGWWMEQLRKDAKASRPEALRLADRLEHGRGDDVIYAKPAAAELRRLHAENQELLEALKEHVQLHDGDCICQGCAAIAKATEEPK